MKDPTSIPASYTGGNLGDGHVLISTSFPGWYQFSAISFNYFDHVYLSSDNATWNSNLTFSNQGIAYVSASLVNALEPPSGNCSVQIQAPNGTVWFSQSSATTTTMNLTRGPFLFSSTNTTGGTYPGLIAWDNGTEVGFMNFSIVNIHTTRLQLSYPFDARVDNATSQQVESVIPVRLLFNDTFTKGLVPGAMVSASLNSSPVQNLAFTETTSGVYDLNLDTTGIPEGYYFLNVTASKAGYAISTFSLHIELQVDTTISGFSGYHQAEHGFNTTITFHYHDLIRDVGIAGASVVVSFGSAEYHVIDGGNGDYSVVVNTTSFGLGQVPFTLTIQKMFHEGIILSGTIDVTSRSAQLDVINGTIDGAIIESIGPFMLNFYHPVYPSTVRYSQASFAVYADGTLSTPIPSLNYTISNIGSGAYLLDLATGPGTLLDTLGIHEVYIVATNGSLYPFHVSNDTAVASLYLTRRAVTSTVYLNATDITAIPSVVVGSQDDFTLNITVMDSLSAGFVTGYTIQYNITSGISEPMVLSGNSYITAIDHDDLSSGTYFLRIQGTSPYHDTVSYQYVFTVQAITTYIENFTSYVLVEHGFNASISLHYHDAIHDVGVAGATVNISVSGVGQLAPGEYVVVDSLNGDYEIQFNSTSLGLGTRAFSASLGKQYHTTSVANGNLDVQARRSRLVMLNGSITGYLQNDIGPLSLKY
nr:hypothetical protein [Candidatus Sigynarchaeota archaeon]